MEAQELGQELADVIMAAREKGIDDSMIRLPIDEIDGVVCRANIMPFKEDTGLIFQIDTCMVRNGWDIELARKYKTGQTKLTRTEVLEFCVEILTELPLLKLDIHGKLVNSEKAESDTKLDNIFKKLTCSNLKIRGDECSVCYNKTYTKTRCKHPLCFRCWSKIEDAIDYNHEDEDDENNCAHCPICRERLN